MGEPPIFSCKAHVFTIDPKTKKTWLPASNQAIKVSFFYDKSREVYRILSIDESIADPAKRMTINSLVSERMSFKKTSQKFGQWADPASNSVYGLGFANEGELDRFVEQFCQALDHTRRLRRHVQQYEPAAIDHHQQQAVDLDSHTNTDKDRLMQLNARLQKLEAENQGLRAAAAANNNNNNHHNSRSSEQESRTIQLEKENAMLKNKIRQLEETIAQHEQLLKEAPSIANELQRKLTEAADLSGQLVHVMLPPAPAASATANPALLRKY